MKRMLENWREIVLALCEGTAFVAVVLVTIAVLFMVDITINP